MDDIARISLHHLNQVTAFQCEEISRFAMCALTPDMNREPVSEITLRFSDSPALREQHHTMSASKKLQRPQRHGREFVSRRHGLPIANIVSK